MSLEDALKTLSDAHGSTALVLALSRVQGQVKRARKAAQAQLSTMAQTFVEAMRLWDAQTADGVSRAERLAGLEQSLRAAWPRGRSDEWKYLCARCSDYGLEMFDCPGDATCGRDKPHRPHEFGKPCWCSIGKRFTAPPKADDFAEAGRVRKQKPGWSRSGR